LNGLLPFARLRKIHSPVIPGHGIQRRDPGDAVNKKERLLFIADLQHDLSDERKGLLIIGVNQQGAAKVRQVLSGVRKILATASGEREVTKPLA
jgi:hypothetical protein